MSSGRRRRMVWWPSRRRSSATCWRGSTGGTRSGPGDRRWPADAVDSSCMTTGGCDSLIATMAAPNALPDDIDALRAALIAEQLLRREAEARASGAEAMVAHLKLLIAKLRHDRFGASSERGRKLLEQLEAPAPGEASTPATDGAIVQAFPRRKPVRTPLPEHLPRERVVIPGPTACPCCGGRLSKLGETITES